MKNQSYLNVRNHTQTKHNQQQQTQDKSINYKRPEIIALNKF